MCVEVLWFYKPNAAAAVPDQAGGEDVDVLNIQFTGPHNLLRCCLFQCINVRLYISSLSPACEVLCTSGPNLMSRY